MTIFLILFFLSLIGIIFMIAKKLLVLDKIQEKSNELPLFETPNLREIKQTAISSARFLGHKTLLLILRIYIISANFLKQRKNHLFEKVKKVLHKRGVVKTPEINPEPSKFIKMVSDYKRKIRRMTHRIKQE